MAIVRDLSDNRPINAPIVDPHYDKNYPTYQLASNATLLSGASSTQFSISGGNYIFNTEATYGGATLTLESKGSDGIAWEAITTRTASGNGTAPLYFGGDTVIRLTASGGNIVGLYASLT